MSAFKNFQPRTEILPDSQKEVWSLLKPAAKMGFTLYGGTAIALQLGHRQSVDFDLFTDSKLNENAIFRKMSFLKRAQVIQASENTLTMAYPVDKEHVKISMFGGIAFGRVGSPLVANGNELPVASLDDLMATKLKVILQRAEKKDYMDIAEMIRSGVSLGKGVGSACSMFGKAFPPKDCLAEVNPCYGVRRNVEKARTRCPTQEEIEAVNSVAPLAVALTVELAYYTGQRRADLLKLRLADLTEAGIQITQGKTGAKLLIRWSPGLRDCVNAIKALDRPVRGLFLICNRRGQPYTDSGFKAMWGKAMDKALKEGLIQERFHFHDIRAAAITAADEANMDAQGLTGHKEQGDDRKLHSQSQGNKNRSSACGNF